MADVTAHSELPYPESTDSDNVPADLKALADKLDGKGLEHPSVYHPIFRATQLLRNDVAAGSYFMGSGGAVVKSGEAVGDVEAPLLLFSPGSYSIPGKTTKMAMQIIAATNGTAPGRVVKVGLAPVTSSGAADVLALTLGTNAIETEKNLSAANTVSGATLLNQTVMSEGGYAAKLTVEGGAIANNSVAVVTAIACVYWV